MPARRPQQTAAGRYRGLLTATILTAATLGLFASGAAAAVTIDPQTITVTTAAGQAVVSRSPFRIAVQDRAGQTVLAESANSSPFPRPLIPSAYPAPLGGKPEPENDLYAPLTFLVGAATTTQWGGGQAFFQGNEQGGTVSGIQYSAQTVLSATQAGDGVALVVSTDDPTGRKLLVTVAPGPDGTVRVVASPSPSTGVALVSDAFASDPGEQFHGFGGRHNAIDQHGHDFYSWIEEENSSGVSGGQALQDAAAGQPNYMFPNGPTASYMDQALFYSSRPYGFMLDQPDFARWRLDSDQPDTWQVSAYGSQLNYLVAPGPAGTAVSSLTAITGRERVPPEWAIAPEIDRAMRADNPQSAAEAANQISSDLTNIARYHLSVSSYRPETWTLLDAATQSRFAAELAHDHIHLMRYFRAFVASPSAGFEPEGDYSYAIAHHLVATRADGSPATFGSPYENGQAALIDFTNPAAVSWWQGRIREALDQGADGFMQDFGEQVNADWHFDDGETGATMHNRYPILYDHATREVIDQYERQHPSRHIFFFTRAGYSGDPGSTAYENAEFLGDNTTSWDHASGLAAVIPDELNRSVGGAYGPTTDIGGYLDLLTPPTSEELFVRWAELSALTPFYRVHDSGQTGTEMPWDLGAAAVKTYAAMAELHIAAEPLIVKLWHQADRTGTPVMRPLWLSYPNDAQASAQDEQWLLGPDVLVAPVVTEGAETRTVDFPTGCWADPLTGARYRGPAAITVSAPLQTLPYFFACGTRPFSLPEVASAGCPHPPGRLSAATIGPIRLGMPRAQARHALRRSRRHTSRYIDFFCLAGGGIRVVFPSPRLLRTQSGRQRRRIRGRAVLVLTANPHYQLRGVHTGERLRSVAHRLRPSRPMHIGLNDWYVCPDGAQHAILKVRRGRIEELGIAPTVITPNRAVTRTFLSNLG